MKAKLKKPRAASKAHGTETDLGKIIEEEFGRYRIRAGRLSGNFVARAFPKLGSNSQGLMAEAAGASGEEAIEALKDRLRERDVQRTAARRWEPRGPSSARTGKLRWHSPACWPAAIC